MIIDSIVSILDKILSLLKYKKLTRRAVFEDQVEPVFADLILIHSDYRRMFSEIEAIILAKQRPTRTSALISLIKRRRQELAIIREKSNALALILKDNTDIPGEAAEFFSSVCFYFSIGSGNDYIFKCRSAGTTLINLFEEIEESQKSKQSNHWDTVNRVVSLLENSWNVVLRRYAIARVALLHT